MLLVALKLQLTVVKSMDLGSVVRVFYLRSEILRGALLIPDHSKAGHVSGPCDLGSVSVDTPPAYARGLVYHKSSLVRPVVG